MNNKKRPRKFFAWFMAVVPFVLVISLGWLTYRDVQQQELDYALLEAARETDHVTMAKLLQQGANPNTRAPNGPPSSVLERLYTKFIPRKSQTQVVHGSPVLLIAFFRRSPECVRLLAHHGADINVPDLGNMTLLESAIALQTRTSTERRKMTEIVAALLENGADPNQRTGNNRLPLTWAIDRKMPQETIALLRKYGAHE